MGDMADEIAVASPSRPDGDWAPRAGETTRGAPFSKENELKLPVYIEVEDSACVAAWLACNGQHLPLKRVVDELAVMLPGAPVSGAEAEAARQLAERLDDVRIAAAILAGAAEKAELAIDATRYIRFVPIVAQRE
jgi:hypothetical protein